MRVGPDTQYHRYHNLKSWRRHRRKKGFAVTRGDLLTKIQERYGHLSEAEKNELYEQLTVNAREALIEVLAAWDSLAQGHYHPMRVERWLKEEMKPAMDQARRVLGEQK